MTQTHVFNITSTFLEWMIDKNLDSTKNLLLHGRHLFEKIGRRIEDSDLHLICAFLTDHPDVVAVQLCYNNISDDGMAILVVFLKTNRTVKHLDLMLNNIGPDGIEKLAAFGEDLNLESLRLNGNKIGPEGGIHLSKLLQVNKTLIHLDLGETDQSIKSIAYLVPTLRENVTLKHLDISRVLGPPSYVFDLEHCTELIGVTISVNHTITELHLQKLGINDFAVEILVEGLKENKSILMLDLSCNCIGDSGANNIAELLKINPPLQALMLNHNQIRNLGAEYISYNSSYSKLRFLDLAHNCLTDDGIIFILYAVRKPYNLLVLFFWGNEMTVRTLKVLEDMLKENMLQQSSLDTKVYRDEFNELQKAYNSSADIYKQRYYSVIPKFKEMKDNPPLGPNDLHFEHHNVVRSWNIEPRHSLTGTSFSGGSNKP